MVYLFCVLFVEFSGTCNGWLLLKSVDVRGQMHPMIWHLHHAVENLYLLETSVTNVKMHLSITT